MELLRNLFEGYPNLWGGGVAHSVLILSLVITFGIMLGKLKVAGISLGVTWILFVGIVFGHFDMNLDEHLLHFLKEFGLILFVYSIGLQVGTGILLRFQEGRTYAEHGSNAFRLPQRGYHHCVALCHRNSPLLRWWVSCPEP